MEADEPTVAQAHRLAEFRDMLNRLRLRPRVPGKGRVEAIYVQLQRLATFVVLLGILIGLVL